jgi:hypothetical protein
VTPFDADQARTAEWLGCSVEQMNRDHDGLHHALCGWLGVPSHSMADAAGESFDGNLAALEETAVLHLQRFANLAGADLSRVLDRSLAQEIKTDRVNAGQGGVCRTILSPDHTAMEARHG